MRIYIINSKFLKMPAPTLGGWWDFPDDVDTKLKEARAAGISVVKCTIRTGGPCLCGVFACNL